MRTLLLIFSSLFFLNTSIIAQKVSVGNAHHMELCDGKAYTKGENGNGQLGIGVTGGIHPNLNQVVLPNTEYVKFIDAGQKNSFMVTDPGNVWAVGNNSDGELGNGTFVNSNSPVQVLGVGGTNLLSDIIQIDSGTGPVVIALNRYGEVLQWGYNYGIPSSNTPNYILKANGARLSNIVKIANGSSGMYALDKDGYVWSWGYQNYGELGYGILSFYSTINAIQVPGISEVEDINAGNYFILALKKDGSVWAWGKNYSGNCGLGYFTNKVTIPSQVKSVSGQGFLSGIVEIGANDDTAFAIDSSGQVFGWGNNTTGALGNAQVMYRSNRPVPVTGLNGQGNLVGVTEIEGSATNTVARLSNCEYVYFGWTNIAGFNYNVQTQNIPRLIDFSELPCCEGWGDIETVTPSSYTICEGGCIDVSASLYFGEADVSWDLLGSTLVTATGLEVPNVCYNTPGTYTITAEENDGNSSAISIQITVLPASSRPCQILAPIQPQIAIYPNPSTGQFEVQLENIDDLIKYRVKDIFGKEVIKQETSSSGFYLNLEDQKQGVYFLEIETMGVKKIHKLIKY